MTPVFGLFDFSRRSDMDMIQLPKTKINPKDTEGICKCRPVCKNRRRKWKGQIQNTSAELLIERKPLAECFRRWPMKILPNGPCPLFARNKGVFIQEKYAEKPPPIVVRICDAPMDVKVDTPYLTFTKLAEELGAFKAVKNVCPFCQCCNCCACAKPREYTINDNDPKVRKKAMRVFDKRIKTDYKPMQIMYDKI